MVDEQIDTAIVGGGVSGVYSAWRLQQAQPGARIVVFEGGDHIGGRLLSVRPPDIPDMVAELGGMRILPAVQPRITHLLTQLNRILPPGQRIETYDFPVDQPQNIAYLRGTYLRLSDFTACPDKVPYNLSFLERGGTAGSIIVNAIEQIVPGITDPTLGEAERQQMAQRASFAGKPLYQQGFWNVLMRIISNEAYQLCADAGGYNSTLENWNAADAIPWYLSDFGVNPDYKGFKNGFQDVPLRLAELFRAAGGDIRLHARLDGFQRSHDGFELAIHGKTVRARTLILAMPRRSLELLMPGAPLLREIQELITSVTPRPLFKLFTTYDNPWWRAAGYTVNGTYLPVQAGRTVTDLPVRQTYYWPQSSGLPATAGPAMLMASYDDGANIGFWDGLRAQRRAAWAAGHEILEPDDAFVAAHPEPATTTWSAYKPSRRMVAEVVRQLSAIHGLSYTPAVRNAAFRDWGTDPFGGGWNSWNIGVKSWEVKPRIVQPFADAPLFICGEAYSDAQGWVEGALQTADLMLAKLGLPPL
ncbi:MAG TPA: NAD(P)/FAD-dependent oxidoreductase [Kofleriaceae bacterium]|nr:NAD(P)/FAD-dependent oxidoreductase [Kofleriaceae bacterium]